MPDFNLDTVAIELNRALPHLTDQVNDACTRKRLWISVLKENGRLHTGVPGSIAEMFPIKYKRPPVKTFNETTQFQYSPKDHLLWGQYEWRMKYVDDAMSFAEFLKTDSKNTIVNRHLSIVQDGFEALETYIGTQLYSNSTATGHTDDFDGIETACGVGVGTCGAADIVAVPSGTYQGRSTTLGQSGSWSEFLAIKPNATIGTDWPDGDGDPNYGYRSPVPVNWSSTGWGTGKTTFESNGERVVSRAASWIRNTQGGNGTGKALFAMLASNLYEDLKNSIKARGLVLLPHKQANDLGFPGVLNYEGIGLYSEPACPADTGYVLDLDDVELNFITKNMIDSYPFTKWESDMMQKWLAVSAGQIKLDPRRIAKLKNYA